ncbi:MAG: nitroreductase [Candidatus Poriferisodalaceae bacterium]
MAALAMGLILASLQGSVGVVDTYDAMSTLRAVRRLRTDPIPDDVMERVLQAACWAPTGGNQQPWRVIVVRSDEKKRALQDIYEPEWFEYAKGWDARLAVMSEEERPRWERILDAGNHLAEHLAEAPAILMFLGNPKFMAITDAKLDRISMVGGGSVYTAVQNAMLACVVEGLGCTLTTLHCLKEPEVKAALDIPDPWATLAMVPIGYPVGKGHGPITRQPPAAMAFDDTFGTEWA